MNDEAEYRNVYERYLEYSGVSMGDARTYENGALKGYYYWRQNYLKFLPANKDARILELGCGWGMQMMAVKMLGYTNVVGVDVSGECVQICKQHDLQAEQRDIASFLDACKEQYDVIFLHYVFEHMTRKEALWVLGGIAARLSAQGMLIITVPNGWNLFGGALRDADLTHEVSYTSHSLGQVLRMSGYGDVVIFSTNMYAAYDKNIVARVLKTIFWGYSLLIELLIRAVMLSFGLFEKEIRPNLVAVARLRKR